MKDNKIWKGRGKIDIYIIMFAKNSNVSNNLKWLNKESVASIIELNK